MAENQTVRLGLVSSVNYKTGMIKVTYPEYDNSVTDSFPCFAFGDEYKMPGIGEEVLVLHLSNGSEAGVVMGKYWNVDNRPPAAGKSLFHKELGAAFGEAYMECLDGRILFHDQDVDITLSDIVKRLEKLEGKQDEDKSGG